MKHMSATFHRVLYDPSSRGFLIVNDLLAALTLLSVLALILETVPALAEYASVFTYIEYAAVFCFTLEYLARIVANRRHRAAYIFSFFGIIDLLSITPTLLGVTNLTFLKTARILRILHFLRMIRLAKIVRLQYANRRDVEDYRHLYRLNVGIYFFALFSAVTVFGTLIYIIEGKDPSFESIPLGMLWAIKPLMGGVAQTEPTTVVGEMVAVAARFIGLILFGLLIAIVGNAAKRVLFGSTDLERAS